MGIERELFLADLKLAEDALLRGDLDLAQELLPPEHMLWLIEDDPKLVNRFWIAHAVATDRKED